MRPLNDQNVYRRGFLTNPQWIGVICLAHLTAGWMILSSSNSPMRPLPIAEMSISLLPPASPSPIPPAIRPTPAKPVPTQATSTLPRPDIKSTQAPPVESASIPASPVTSSAAPVNTGAPIPTTPVISAPRFDAAYLNNPAPTYPPLSRRMGEEGRCVLSVHVAADGYPKNISVAQSSGSPRLDNAAINAVWKWKFIAAQQSGQAVAANVHVPIVFKLN